MKGSPLKEIAAHLNVSCVNETLISGFAIDSRKVRRGEIFFALPGAKVDGHDFLRDVAQKGASGAVVSKNYEGEDFGLSLIRVEDVRQALQKLAQIAASRRKEKRIAVTGSVGKTTTKEFIAALLQKRFRVGFSEGNSNSQLTFPLFWLNLIGEYDFFVIEMGMTHEGEIRRLVEIAPPDLALITRIAPAHISFFSDGLRGIARAKAEIFSHPRTQIKIASWQAMEFEEVRKDGGILVYGVGGDFLLKTEEAGIVIDERGVSVSPLLIPPFRASHLLENLLAAISVARVVGLSWEEIRSACAELKPHALRYEIERRGEVIFVKDCYNANPLSMQAALANLPLPEGKGRRIGVLGTMVDQGDLSVKHHVEAAQFALQHLDMLYCIGTESAPMVEVFTRAGKPAQFINDISLLKQQLFDLVRAGDVVLIKGSNFLKLWQLLET